MTIYCKIIDGVIVARERKRDPKSAMVDGFPIWRELVMAGDRPAYNRDTHYAPEQSETIEDVQVVQRWGDAVAKTAAKITADANNRRDQAVEQLGPLFDTVFSQENRLRVLEGTPSITKNAFIRGLR